MHAAFKKFGRSCRSRCAMRGDDLIKLAAEMPQAINDALELLASGYCPAENQRA